MSVKIGDIIEIKTFELDRTVDGMVVREIWTAATVLTISPTLRVELINKTKDRMAIPPATYGKVWR